MNLKSYLALFVLMSAILACGMIPNQPAKPAIVTQVIVIPNQVEITSTPLAHTNSSPASGTLPPFFTLTPTQTLSSTTTNSPTATLSGPVATFIKNANCRQGPGTNYEVVTSFQAGQTVEIVGRNPDFDNTWWYVKIPGSNGKCWVSLTTAQAYGDFDAIPTLEP